MTLRPRHLIALSICAAAFLGRLQACGHATESRGGSGRLLLCQERCAAAHAMLLKAAPAYFEVEDRSLELQEAPGCSFAGELQCVLLRMCSRKDRRACASACRDTEGEAPWPAEFLIRWPLQRIPGGGASQEENKDGTLCGGGWQMVRATGEGEIGEVMAEAYK